MYNSSCVRTRVERVFARYLDVAAPTGLASKVDDGGPEGRPSLARVHERAGLVADLAAGELPQSAVEGHASGDGEGEFCRLVVIRDAGGGLQMVQRSG